MQRTNALFQEDPVNANEWVYSLLLHDKQEGFIQKVAICVNARDTDVCSTSGLGQLDEQRSYLFVCFVGQ